MAARKKITTKDFDCTGKSKLGMPSPEIAKAVKENAEAIKEAKMANIMLRTRFNILRKSKK
jgi:hypothetical protein